MPDDLRSGANAGLRQGWCGQVIVCGEGLSSVHKSPRVVTRTAIETAFGAPALDDGLLPDESRPLTKRAVEVASRSAPLYRHPIAFSL